MTDLIERAKAWAERNERGPDVDGLQVTIPSLDVTAAIIRELIAQVEARQHDD